MVCTYTSLTHTLILFQASVVCTDTSLTHTRSFCFSGFCGVHVYLTHTHTLILFFRQGNPEAFPIPHIMTMEASCNFSFAGLSTCFMKLIGQELERLGPGPAAGVPPNVGDICATFQHAILHHLAKRVQRALIYCEHTGLLPEDLEKTMVLSGGVASNAFLRQGLERVCRAYDTRLVCPPPRLCTDNGIMIGWTGVEKLLIGSDVMTQPEETRGLRAERRSPMGRDVAQDVRTWNIHPKKINLLSD